MFFHRDCPLPNPPLPSRTLRLAVAAHIAVFLAGCTPLAQQHEYFAGTRASVVKIDAETQRTLRHVHASQMTRRACAGSSPVDVPREQGVHGAPDGQALADQCAAVNPSPAAWHGGAANAYRRWVEDRALELPDPGETVKSAGDS